MDRRDFLKTLGAGAASLLIPGCVSDGGMFGDGRRGKRPNIIFIMTDDQGPWAFGAAPNPNARTPNIDRLRREGARLTSYFVTTPVCSPSRAGLLTSRYSTEVSIPDYLEGGSNLGLSREFVTWPQVLSRAGYATALIGKWHLGKPDEFYPTHYGYDEFTGFRVGGEISRNPQVEVSGRVKRIEGYTPDILTDFAIDFIKRKKSHPFLLSVHFWAPHANTANKTPDGDRTWLPLSEADWSQFRDSDPALPHPDYPKLDIPRAKRMMREYLASVAGVDRNVGRLLALLDELGLAENTVVIFTSDNGYNLAHNGIWHKGNGRWLLTDNRGDRPNMYDNSLKVPAIIRWPGAIQSGAAVDQTVTNLDWFPTILAMAGLAVPKGGIIRGRNFLPLLEGKGLAWDNDLFAVYTMWDWHQNGAVLRCYRTHRWKLVRDFKHEAKDELYDLVSDPEERRNLIDSPDPEIREKREWLNAMLLERMRQIADPALRQKSAQHVASVEQRKAGLKQ
ncbi:MAG TPA: sulfatase-like hydrolase/transferase [Sedimentisphaerales bacterium]|nr:sulfatase-like hydrolase/transferase [Sedimentisphaerales bacterium]